MKFNYKIIYIQVYIFIFSSFKIKKNMYKNKNMENKLTPIKIKNDEKIINFMAIN